MTERKKKVYELVLSSTIQQVAKVEKFLAKMNRTLHLTDDQYYKLLVATTEAVNNSIIHGNKRDPAKKVTLKCILTTTDLVVSVRDEGKGFDLDHLPDPLAEENLMRDHGRGVFLIRSLMDNVKFAKTPAAGSEVIMTLHLKEGKE